MFRDLKPHQLVLDATIAVAFYLLMFQVSVRAGAEYGLIVGMSAVLLLRRLSPASSLAIAWVTAIPQMYVEALPPDVADLAILAALYSSAAYGNRALKWIGLASVGAGAALGSSYLTLSGQSSQFGLNSDLSRFSNPTGVVLQIGFLLIAMLVLLGLPWVLGLLVRTRIGARQSREAQLSAQRDAAIAEEGVIVEQERNRIARDMHDVVAHSLAVVIALADGARYARATDPAAADQALSTISSTARDALADVRLLLEQLRHSQEQGPQPGLADLPRLLDQLRASGLTISHETAGELLVLGAGQQLAVYRIVQEALTNALRHGDTGKEVAVRFDWTSTDLRVTVTSWLAASPRTAELRVSHGIPGMRERAVLAGGSLETEERDRRFVVTATVPAAVSAVSA